MEVETSGQRPHGTAFDSQLGHSNAFRNGNTQHHHDGAGGGTIQRRATALGWLSIGLGVAGIAAPRQIARLCGLPAGNTATRTLRAIGLREVACGIGLLSRAQPLTWTWARVAGDIIDVALVSTSIGGRRSERALATTAALVSVALLDAKTALDLTRSEADRHASREWPGFVAKAAITVNRSPEETYRYWRNFANFPFFMQNLEEVRALRDERWLWRAKGPLGVNVEWTAEMTEDQPGERIAWRSIPGSEVPNQGSVRFTPAPQGGTEIRVEIVYEPPAGRLGSAVAKLFGADPKQEIAGDLRRFKQMLELGEVLRSDASVHRGPHPARPSGKVPENALTPQPTRVIS